MEKIWLWLFLLVGVTLLGIVLRKPPLKDWLLSFFITAYFAIFLGELAVINNLLSYPVKLFPIFESSILYENILLPTLGVVYYQTTYHKSILTWLWQSFIYGSLVTVIETFLRLNTDFVYYISWHWYYTWVSQFLFFLMIRSLLSLINSIVRKRKAPGRKEQ